MKDKAFNEGKRPEGYCRLVWDDDLGFWVYAKDGRRRRATDLEFTPNYAPINNDAAKQKASGYEPYPLEFLERICGSREAALMALGTFGQMYRKVERA